MSADAYQLALGGVASLALAFGLTDVQWEAISAAVAGLAGLAAVAVALLAMSPLAFRGGPLIRRLAHVYAVLMAELGNNWK